MLTQVWKRNSKGGTMTTSCVLNWNQCGFVSTGRSLDTAIPAIAPRNAPKPFVPVSWRKMCPRFVIGLEKLSAQRATGKYTCGSQAPRAFGEDAQRYEKYQLKQYSTHTNEMTKVKLWMQLPNQHFSLIWMPITCKSRVNLFVFYSHKPVHNPRCNRIMWRIYRNLPWLSRSISTGPITSEDVVLAHCLAVQLRGSLSFVAGHMGVELL